MGWWLATINCSSSLEFFYDYLLPALHSAYLELYRRSILDPAIVVWIVSSLKCSGWQKWLCLVSKSEAVDLG